MSFLRWLSWWRQDPLSERAGTLVPAAGANAAGSFTPLLKAFPVLDEVGDLARWDFFVMVAGVWMAMLSLRTRHLGQRREYDLSKMVGESLSRRSCDGVDGANVFVDCMEFFERESGRLAAAGHEARWLAEDTVGAWIVLNILGRAPRSEEDCKLVRAVGTLVTHAFSDWWDE